MAGKITKILLPVFWASIIFYLSSVPNLSSPFGIWDLYLRKSAHITEYFILAILISINFPKKTRLLIIISVLIAAIYAVTDEYHQSFVPGRSMEFTDMVWDWIGCMFAYMFLVIRMRRGNERYT